MERITEYYEKQWRQLWRSERQFSAISKQAPDLSWHASALGRARQVDPTCQLCGPMWMRSRRTLWARRFGRIGGSRRIAKTTACVALESKENETKRLDKVGYNYPLQLVGQFGFVQAALMAPFRQ